MNTIENIKKVSLIFFIATGFLHLGSSIFIANQIFIKQATLLNKIMDIPFVITGMIYAFSSLRISLTDPEENHKVLDIFFISVIILVLAALIFINLLLADLN